MSCHRLLLTKLCPQLRRAAGPCTHGDEHLSCSRATTPFDKAPGGPSTSRLWTASTKNPITVPIVLCFPSEMPCMLPTAHTRQHQDHGSASAGHQMSRGTCLLHRPGQQGYKRAPGAVGGHGGRLRQARAPHDVAREGRRPVAQHLRAHAREVPVRPYQQPRAHGAPILHPRFRV